MSTNINRSRNHEFRQKGQSNHDFCSEYWEIIANFTKRLQKTTAYCIKNPEMTVNFLKGKWKKLTNIIKRSKNNHEFHQKEWKTTIFVKTWWNNRKFWPRNKGKNSKFCQDRKMNINFVKRSQECKFYQKNTKTENFVNISRHNHNFCQKTAKKLRISSKGTK